MNQLLEQLITETDGYNWDYPTTKIYYFASVMLSHMKINTKI